MAEKIYIYNDEGVGSFSLYSIQNYFKDEDITLISAQELIKNGIPHDTNIFVIPGGADKPYAKKLNGHGNKIIKDYVEKGGIYLGICAGAYYACEKIEFQKSTPNEICEDRELKFFKGKAIGCIKDIALPYDQTLKSASITNVDIDNNSIPVFYWGGCYFSNNDDNYFKIIASYNNVEGYPAAIISCPIGKGKAILSGVHFEVTNEGLIKYDFNNSDDNFIKYDFIQKMDISKHLSLEHIYDIASK